VVFAHGDAVEGVPAGHCARCVAAGRAAGAELSQAPVPPAEGSVVGGDAAGRNDARLDLKEGMLAGDQLRRLSAVDGSPVSNLAE
jgi:hypothetical protein